MGLGLMLLVVSAVLTWMTVAQFRTREVFGETIFDLAGAVIPPLKRPMFWASTIFLGFGAAFTLVGAVVNFAVAAGYIF